MQELEQSYTKAIDELKQENGELKTQMDKLNDELIITRAECGALANEINGVKYIFILFYYFFYLFLLFLFLSFVLFIYIYSMYFFKFFILIFSTR